MEKKSGVQNKLCQGWTVLCRDTSYDTFGNTFPHCQQTEKEPIAVMLTSLIYESIPASQRCPIYGVVLITQINFLIYEILPNGFWLLLYVLAFVQ